MDPKKVILVNHLSPGDVAVMTAAVYSLHKAHPGKYKTAVDTTANELFEHNPDVYPLEKARAEMIQAQPENWEVAYTNYDLINQCNQVAEHMMHGYCRFFENAWGINVPLATNRPMIYLSAEEKGWIPQVQEITGKPTKYALVCAGRKQDYSAKFAGTKTYQEIVNRLRGKVLFVQIGAAEHVHPPLENVVNLVGKTDLRQLVRLCYHADFGLGGVTLLMHLMAAFEKPYVCLAGGREPVCWNSYPRQQLLHTVGMLDCCKDGGCWRSRTVKLGDGDSKDESLCEQPVPINGEYVPRCLAMLKPERVAELIADFT